MIKRLFIFIAWILWVFSYPTAIVWAPIYYIITGKNPIDAWFNFAVWLSEKQE